MCACAAAPPEEWEANGTDSIMPSTEDVNITPNPSSPGDNKNMVGTPNHPWDGATFASPNFTLLFHANRGAERIIMGFEVIPNWATMTARINMIQLDEESELAVLSLRQMSPEAPLTVLAGTEANDQDATISKVNGTGAVDGPKKKFGMDTYGWKFANKMEKVNLNGTIYYRPLYLPDVVEE